LQFNSFCSSHADISPAGNGGAAAKPQAQLPVITVVRMYAHNTGLTTPGTPDIDDKNPGEITVFHSVIPRKFCLPSNSGLDKNSHTGGVRPPSVFVEIDEPCRM